jgi:choline dehydrogenase-like flavoprotein
MPDMDNRSIPYERGKVLGGSTAISMCCQGPSYAFNTEPHLSIDFMAYSRGSKDDFNRWASVTGDAGWSWNNVFPYFLKALTNITFLRLNLTRAVDGNFDTPHRRSFHGRRAESLDSRD